MLHKIESDKPFDVVSIYFWEPGDIPYRDEYGKILTCMDCMTKFGLRADIRLKEITSDQDAQWYFGKLFVPFGLPKMNGVDADGLFS